MVGECDMLKYINIIAGKSDKKNKYTWLPFKIHSLDTAGIIGQLYDNWLSESVRNYISDNLNMSSDINLNQDKVRNYCCLIALLHDIGKVTPAFQSKITMNIENHRDKLLDYNIDISKLCEVNKSPHNVAGQVILESYNFSKEFSSIIGAHHGRVSTNLNYQMQMYSSNYFGHNSLQKDLWKDIWTDWINFSLNTTEFESIDQIPKPNVKLQMILSGLLIMSDWIASNKEYFPYISIDDNIDSINIEKRIFNAWRRLDLPDSWNVDNIYDLTSFFENRFGFEPNQVQKEVTDIVFNNECSGLYILEAPMGIGKTETALAMSELIASTSKQGGIYFGLPTQATANGIFKRIYDWSKFYDDGVHNIRLIHGMTDLNDEYRQLFHGKASTSEDQNIVVHDWFEGKKQALLSNFVIATVDQLLLASLKQRHVMLRHLGLAGKVVIIDECHAYDSYMNIYLDNTLTWLGEYNVPVIILSATLPIQRRNELIKAYTKGNNQFNFTNVVDNYEYPILTWTTNNGVLQKKIDSNIENKKVSIFKIDENSIMNTVLEKASKGGCIGIIVNTVRYAQRLAEDIIKSTCDYEVICFHSNFIATDRADIEKNILNRLDKNSTFEDRKNLIVIGTQVLEQSLDLDFDFMITELCPMDLLLQRSGRLHRHNRVRPKGLENPELAILCCNNTKETNIYSKWILNETERYLTEQISIPEDIPILVNKVYTTPSTEEQNNEEYIEYQKMIQNKKQKANKYCIQASMLNSRRKNRLEYFLDDNVGNDIQAEASVRDTDESIEVIVLKSISQNIYSLVSDSSVTFDITLEPSESEAITIAKSRIKLPTYFSKFYFNQTIQQLDVIPKSWRSSSWLKGELLLLLDDNYTVELLGETLIYDKRLGLKMLCKETG